MGRELRGTYARIGGVKIADYYQERREHEWVSCEGVRKLEERPVERRKRIKES